MPALNPNGSIYVGPKGRPPTPPVRPVPVRPNFVPNVAPLVQAYQQYHDNPAPASGLLDQIAAAMFKPQQVALSPLMNAQGRKTRAGRWGEGYAEGFFDTFDPRTYASMPSDLNYARKHPMETLQALPGALTSPQGLGSLTSGALLGAAGTPGRLSRGAGLAARPKTGQDAVAGALNAERRLRAEQMNLMMQQKARGGGAQGLAAKAKRAGPTNEDTINRALGSMGFFDPYEPRALDAAMEHTARSRLVDSQRPSESQAMDAYLNDEGFFYDAPDALDFDFDEGPGAYNIMDEIEDTKNAGPKKRYDFEGGEIAAFDQMDAPLYNADRFFSKAFGSPLHVPETGMKYLIPELRESIFQGLGGLESFRLGTKGYFPQGDSPLFAGKPRTAIEKGNAQWWMEFLTDPKRRKFYPGRGRR